MIEHTQPVTNADGAELIEIRAPVAPWQHVRMMGEDMSRRNLYFRPITNCAHMILVR